MKRGGVAWGAVLAAVVAMEGGTQVAFLAPTELLAMQHFRTLSALLAATAHAPHLLIGSLSARMKAAARAAVFSVYAKALDAFTRGEFVLALDLFGRIAADDPAAASYLRRCRHCLDEPPVEWIGVCVMTSK